MTSAYLGELFQQPEALRRAIGEFPSGAADDLDRARTCLESGEFHNIVLTGMGASLHGCYPLHLTLASAISIPSAVWDASELVHFAQDLITDKTLLIAVSQSGESVELRRLVELKQRPGMVISVTNGSDNTLAHWADVSLLTRAGDEASVSNKTYTTGLAILHLLGYRLAARSLATARDALIEAAQRLEGFLEVVERQVNQAAQSFTDARCLAFVGRGYSLASARAGSLITQEASKLPCMAYSGGEFRHGPLELARAGFRAVIFAGSGAASLPNQRLAREICEAGGHVLLVSSSDADRSAVKGMSIIPVPEVEPALLPILEIVPIQFLTIPLAQAKGHEPGKFERASKVTVVE